MPKMVTAILAEMCLSQPDLRLSSGQLYCSMAP